MGAAALSAGMPTSFNEGGLWVKETTEMNLGPDADVLPLCEDLNPGTVGNGDSCWSACSGQCPNDVLKPGLAFDFDEIKQGHPGCTSHFECVGNKDRVLCHAIRATEELSPAPLALAVVPQWPRTTIAGIGHQTSSARHVAGCGRGLRSRSHLALIAGHFL
mmetsp:Transcript_114001/g.368318  ORF Transcript_114001/g.368318 Transcript_114001/m.368318 type:complete len:161 (-) Transcript_114001:42-524(-)